MGDAQNNGTAAASTSERPAKKRRQKESTTPSAALPVPAGSSSSSASRAIKGRATQDSAAKNIRGRVDGDDVTGDKVRPAKKKAKTTSAAAAAAPLPVLVPLVADQKDHLSTLEWGDRHSATEFFMELAIQRGKKLEVDLAYRGGKQMKLKCTSCSGFCIVARKKSSLNKRDIETFQFLQDKSCLEHFSLDSDNNKVPCAGTIDPANEAGRKETKRLRNLRMQAANDKKSLSTMEWESKAKMEKYLIENLGRQRGFAIIREPPYDGRRVRLKCRTCSGFRIVGSLLKSRRDPSINTYQLRSQPRFSCLAHFSLNENNDKISCPGCADDSSAKLSKSTKSKALDNDDDDEEEEDDDDDDDDLQEDDVRNEHARMQALEDMERFSAMTWPTRGDMIAEVKQFATERGIVLLHDTGYRGGRQLRLKCKGCTAFCITGRTGYSGSTAGLFALRRQNSCFSHFSLDKRNMTVPCLVDRPHPEAVLPPAKPRKYRGKVCTPEQLQILQAKKERAELNKQARQAAIESAAQRRAKVVAALAMAKKGRESKRLAAKAAADAAALPAERIVTGRKRGQNQLNGKQTQSSSNSSSSRSSSSSSNTRKSLPLSVVDDENQRKLLKAKEAVLLAKHQVAAQKAALKAALLEQKQKRATAKAAKQLVTFKKLAEKAAKNVTATALVASPVATKNQQTEAARIFAAAVAAAAAVWE